MNNGVNNGVNNGAPNGVPNGATRFGELCIARDWVASTDVDAALDAQQELHRLGLPERIGEILRKRGLLTNEQVRELLLQQGTGPLRDLVPGYEIQRRLGQGGMGAVYRAVRRADGVAVALKLLPPRLGNNPDFVARFVREARAAAAMSHPHIVAGLDAGCADDHYFVAMELIEGESLDQWIHRAGALPEADVCALGLAICDALDYASGQGLIHRDIKPGNILIGEGDAPLRTRVKLCDLGLAKWTEDGATAVTQTGLIIGTPQYVAPEQALGVEQVDVRADLYSLGATLYHAATGRAPFAGGAPAEVALRRLVSEPEPARTVRPDLSPGLSAFLGTLLAREPAGRPETAAAAGRALARVAQGERPAEAPTAATDTGTAPTAPTGGGGAISWGAAGLFLGVLIAGGIAMALGTNGAPPPAPAVAPATTPQPAIASTDTPASESATEVPRTMAHTLTELETAREELAAYDDELTELLAVYGRAIDAGLAEQLPPAFLDTLLAQQSRLDQLERRLAQLAEQLNAR